MCTFIYTYLYVYVCVCRQNTLASVTEERTNNSKQVSLKASSRLLNRHLKTMMTELDMWAGGPQLILFPSEMTLAEINENGAKK